MSIVQKILHAAMQPVDYVKRRYAAAEMARLCALPVAE